MKLLRSFVLILIVTAVVMSLSACGGDNSEAPPEGERLSGAIAIDGSSTVYPIMEAITEEYAREHPEVEVTVGTSGTGGGFEKFSRGETDLSNASRPIKAEEEEKLKEAGIEYKEIVLAYDGLSVVVSQQNDFVDKLTVDQLRKIFLADSGATKWSDIDPSWPNETIKIFSPGHDSGTFDYFNEVILEEKPMREDENVALSEKDDVLVQGIQNDPHAIGYFGYAYYYENQDKLKAIAIENKNGEFIKPSNETVQSGTYNPLSRPLFTYVKLSSLKEKPQVADFINYTLTNAGPLADAVGYVGLPEEEYQAQLEEIKGLTK